MTLEEFLRKLNSLRADNYLDVTVVTPDGVHYNVSEITLGEDNEGDPVICISYEE